MSSKKRILHEPIYALAMCVHKTLKLQFEQPTLARQLHFSGPLDSPDRLFQFPTSLKGDETAPFTMVLRPCLVALTERIKTIVKTDHVLLAGGRGTGKSLLGTLLAVHLAMEGYLVIYMHYDAKILLLGEALNEVGRTNLQKVCNAYNFDYTSFRPGVWEFKPQDEDFFSVLRKATGAIVIHDIGDNKNADIVLDVASKLILISSPNSDKLRQIGRYMTGWRRIYMPPWTRSEIMLARARCYPLQDEAMVQARFERMGGSVRCVLEAPPGTSEEAQDLQISNIRVDSLKVFFSAGDFLSLPPMAVKDAAPAGSVGTDLIFKIAVTPDFAKFSCQFVSDYVSRRLAEIFVFAKEDEAKIFVEMLKDQPLTAAFRGHYLEFQAHKLLRKGGASGQLALLPILPTTKSKELTFPPLRETLFENLLTIQTFELGGYYRPRVKNYESVDSFTILNKNLFDDNAKPDELALVGFQVTVSPKHRVNLSGLKKIVDHVRARLPEQESKTPPPARMGKAPPPDLSLFLVFIGDTGVLRTVQTLVLDKGDDAQRVSMVERQFSFTLGSVFQELIKATSQWIAEDPVGE